MIAGAGMRHGDALGNVARRPRHERPLAPCGDPRNDCFDLFGRFARPVDSLREAPAERAVMVDLGEAQILVGQCREAVDGLLRRDAAGADGLEQLFEALRIH